MAAALRISAATGQESVALPVILTHRRLIQVLVLHQLGAVIVAQITGHRFDTGAGGILALFTAVLIPLYLTIVVMAHLVWMAFIQRPERPIHAFGSRASEIVFDMERVLNGLMGLFVLSLFVSAFSFIKDAIPSLIPFSWDQTIAKADAMLHFGYQPYEWLLPVFGHPYMITFLNAVYHGWFFVMTFMLFIACWSTSKDKSRMIFLFSFVLCWSVWGNLAALLLSSAGPVYYARLGFGDTFQPLMDHLHMASQTSPVWALSVQDMLWSGYIGEAPVQGISAMPSMHVASSTLLMMYGFRRARWAGYGLMLMLVFVMIGSVVLGWHYALDGYLGLVAGLLSWRFAEHVLARDETGTGRELKLA